jgi:hypothetical protein
MEVTMKAEQVEQLKKAAHRLKEAGSNAYNASSPSVTESRAPIYFAQMFGAVIYTAGVFLEQHIDDEQRKLGRKGVSHG